MAHLAESTIVLTYGELVVNSARDVSNAELNNIDVLFVSLPPLETPHATIEKYLNFITQLKNHISDTCTVIIFADNKVLPLLCFGIEKYKIFDYKTWISVRRELDFEHSSNNYLPDETKGAVIFSPSSEALHICKVRLPYTYCPACNKTTKDYGGKKHLFHEYGTLMSDVWKDIVVKADEDLPAEIIARVRDMFSIEPNEKMLAMSLWAYDWSTQEETDIELPLLTQMNYDKSFLQNSPQTGLINGDSLVELKKLKSNSIDYIFVDPPYNLQKKYSTYEDSLEMENYLSWCDQWLNECVRVLKPGGFLSILNLPWLVVRHYAFLIQHMNFSSWITWEALSRPVRNIMPANYTVLTCEKPSYDGESKKLNFTLQESLMPLADYYCLRTSCERTRDTKLKPLTNLWTDIHRLKHNSRRYDHPTQLPPKLVERLIAIHTSANDIVLDCFNGVGTTTLCAAVLGRNYLGIEISEKYHETARIRHGDLLSGLNPFRKNDIDPNKKTKNNEEKRYSKPRNETNLTKKQVQLMVKHLSQKLGRIPTLNEALEHLDVPRDFYEQYFKSWSEVTYASKTTGMTEERLSH